MTHLGVILVILGIYMVVMIGIGLAGRKYGGSMNDFMTAGKQGTLIMVTGSYIGSHIGNGIVVGGAEYGAVYGIGGMWYGIGAALSYLLFAAVMARIVYRGNFVTLSDMLEARYGDKITTILMAVLNATANTAVMAGQIMAGKRLFEYIGLNPVMGAVVTTLIVIIYSSMSGLWGVMMTDVIQSTVIFCSVIATVIFIGAKGGFALMAQVLPPESYTVIPFSAETFVMMLGPTALYGLVSSAGFQRTVSCKNERTAIISPIIAALIIIPFVILPVLIGMYGRALWPDAVSGTIIFKVLFEAMPPLLAGLLIASICAAVMSTCDGGLVTITANIVSDIYCKHINTKASEKHLSRLTTWSTVAVGLIALVLSLQFSSIISLFSLAYTFMTAGGLVMILGGVLWKGGTTQGAVASFLAGILCVIVNKSGVNMPLASIFPILPSLIAYVAISLLTKKKEISAAEK